MLSAAFAGTRLLSEVTCMAAARSLTSFSALHSYGDADLLQPSALLRQFSTRQRGVRPRSSIWVEETEPARRSSDSARGPGRRPADSARRPADKPRRDSGGKRYADEWDTAGVGRGKREANERNFRSRESSDSERRGGRSNWSGRDGGSWGSREDKQDAFKSKSRNEGPRYGGAREAQGDWDDNFATDRRSDTKKPKGDATWGDYDWRAGWGKGRSFEQKDAQRGSEIPSSRVQGSEWDNIEMDSRPSQRRHSSQGQVQARPGSRALYRDSLGEESGRFKSSRGQVQPGSKVAEWDDLDQRPRSGPSQGRAQGRAGGRGSAWESPAENFKPKFAQGTGVSDWDELEEEFDDEEGDFDGDRKNRSEMIGEAIYGVSPVQAAIRAGRRELYTLYVQENLRAKKKKDLTAVERIKEEAKAAGADVRKVSKHDLNLMTNNRPHQGLVLDASPLEFTDIDELPTPRGVEPAPCWVALDEVVDPQNLGAVLRSAYFLGAAGVVTCAKNSAPLSGVVSKASAGAMEVLEVHSCRNMRDLLTSAVEQGWRVLAASAHPKAPLATELPKGVPTVIVLGNEGAGLRTTVLRACSGLVRIGTGQPQQGKVEEIESSNEVEDVNSREQGLAPVDEDKEFDESEDVDGVVVDGGDDKLDIGRSRASHRPLVDSLNVSVAAGILLHEMLAYRGTSSQAAES